MATIDEVIHRQVLERRAEKRYLESAEESKRQHEEVKRHNIAEEGISSDRTKKDIAVAELRARIALEIASAREKHNDARLELDKLKGERDALKIKWEHEDRMAKTDAQRKEAWDRYQKDDRDFAEKQFEFQQNMQKSENEIARKEWEYQNPQEKQFAPKRGSISVTWTGPDKRTYNRIIFEGEPGYDEALKQQNSQKTPTHPPGPEAPVPIPTTRLPVPPPVRPPAPPMPSGVRTPYPGATSPNSVPMPVTPPPPMATGTNPVPPGLSLQLTPPPLPSTGTGDESGMVAPIIPAMPNAAAPQFTVPPASATNAPAAGFREGQRIRSKKTGKWATFTNGEIVPD